MQASVPPMAAALPLIIFVLAAAWSTTAAAVVASRLRADRLRTRRRGVRRLDPTLPPERLLAPARDHRARKKWGRIEALRRLASSDSLPEGAREALADALADPDDDVRLAAASALAARADQLAAGLLVASLADRRDGRTRIAAELETFAVRIVGQLLHGLLDDERSDVRFWGLQLIGRSRAILSPDRIEQLIADESADVRAALAEALPNVAAHPAGPLLRLLEDDVWFVRVHAARALGEARVTPGAAAVGELLRDRSWWVRDAAEKALVELGDAGVRQAIRLLDDADPFARDSAAEVLQESGHLDRCVAAAIAGDEAAAALIERARQAGAGRLIDATFARRQQLVRLPAIDEEARGLVTL